MANIPDGVTEIKFSTFNRCHSLKSIDIPASVTKIDKFAFYLSGIESLEVPDAVTEIGDSAFMGCWFLSTIKIPNGIIKFGNSLFHECIRLNNIHIPSSVTELGNEVFSWCSSLSRIEIPEGVTKIGNLAFFRCKKLSDVYCFAKDIPLTGDSVFVDYNDSWPVDFVFSNATLHVPAVSLEAYKMTEPWCNFKNIVAITDDDITSVKTINGEEQSSDRPIFYDLSGRRVQQPSNGLFIKNGKKVMMK